MLVFSKLKVPHVKPLQMDLSWHALNSMIQVKTLYHSQKQRPQRPTHTLTSSSINTHGGNRNKQGGCVTLMWLAVLSSGLAVLWCGPTVLWRNFLGLNTKTRWSRAHAVSERSAYPLQNETWFSPLTSGLKGFGHKCIATPSHRLFDWGLLSKILASMKMGGA